ncbi:DUF6636 domain-containing protein [Mycolicibacterium sp. A43C]
MRTHVAVVVGATAAVLIAGGCGVPAADPFSATDSRASSWTPPAPPTRDDANVDARTYQAYPDDPDSFYFQTPDHGFKCAIYLDPRRTFSAGCQGGPSLPPPAEQAACWSGPHRSAVGIEGGVSKYLCLNQGLFVGPPPDGSGNGDGGWQELPIGGVLIVRGTPCTSSADGITCWDGDHGFSIGRTQNHVW